MKPDPFAVLTTPPPRLSAESVLDFVSDVYGIDGRVAPLDSERDQNFVLETEDGTKVVVKIGNSAEDAKATEFQTEALLHIRAVDTKFPSPDIVPTRSGESAARITAPDGRTHVIRILTWLDGMLMKDAKIESLGESIGRCLSRLATALQEFDHPGPDVPLLWDISHASQLANYVGMIENLELRSACGQHIERFREKVEPVLRRLPKRAIHNDFNPGNVLVDPNDNARVVGIIDFGDVVRAPLIVDVAVAGAYLCMGRSNPEPEIDEFVAAFQRGTPLSDEELELLDDMILTRLVISTIIAHWRAKRFPENSAYIMISQEDSLAAIRLLAARATQDV